MKVYNKSTKLDNVCYDVRGPALDEAGAMEAAGETILKLNIGNPAVFGFHTPGKLRNIMSGSLSDADA